MPGDGLARSTRKESKQLDTLKHLASGAAAGAVSRTSVSPLERLKILLQIQGASRTAGPAKYNGIWQSLGLIYREEGYRGFYKGNGTNVLRIMPYMAVQFATYEKLKPLFKVTSNPGSAPRRLCAGACAGVCSVSVTYPMDLVRTRLSVQMENKNPKYKSIGHAFRTILKEEGGFMSGCLYRGIMPTIMGIAPYVGLNFAVYETLKSYVIRWYVGDVDWSRSVNVDVFMPASLKLLCGCTAGAVAQSVTYPLDVIRRRMQMKGADPNFPYRNTWHAVTSILRGHEGVRGLYKGIWPNLVKVAPAGGMSFLTYEFVKARLNGIPIGLRWKQNENFR